MPTAACVYENRLSADHLLFEREVASCRPQLYPAALKMTGNPTDAEDLLQETLTRAYMGLRGFTPGSNARAWLHRIMANAFVNIWRKKCREPVHVLSPEPETEHPATVSRAIGGAMAQTQSAEDEVLGHFAHSECRQALDGLPDCFKAAIYLADVEGYSYYDVAKIIGVPIGTVTSRLHRARSRLREQLTAHVPGHLAAQATTESVPR
jgi:RNA polymerase sigma-70 factor (ECF subfamily)